ncbi:unnamed protein product [Urochloa decumbens]|uniref:Aminotransferase-like plant mobile domain-containing protein n=1 Tax=Urochloa decumbens TaxID=240449 RepID=A0ABC8WEC3_9POAL
MSDSDDDDSDVIVLIHQLPVDMDGPDEGRLAHLLPPLHRAPPPPPPPPFRPPPSPQAVSSAEHRLSFRGWFGAPRHWELWVAKLRPLHAPLWRRLGIHDAVLSSTYRIKPDASTVLHLASFWSPATSSFAFPWGEATLSLHDVAHIAGLPATGSPVPAPLRPEWRPDEAGLNGVRLGFNRSACKKAHLSAWIKHFLTDQNDVVLEHAAFLALWLTRFVLPGHPDSTMRQSVFPIAVRLARGERVALAPAVLASLYRDLRDIKAFLVAAGAAATTGNVDMLAALSLYSPIYILHIWIWERFPALRPGKENLLGDGEPMAARWHDLSRKVKPALIREVLSSRDNFLSQVPYAASLKKYSGWVCSSDLAGNDELRLLAYCLRPCELVGMDCIEQYLPHRVARQFGLDQDVPMDVRRANQDWVVAWQTYELEGKNVSLFIPHSEPGITARYAQWWRVQLPPPDLHTSSIPVESKTSRRKVKKTPAAMEADAEKERRMKKPRVSPTDKKRKLEELYDPKFSGWLAAGRSGISDAAGSSCKKGSFPKYDIGSDEALLPNVGATNDDVVLLLPRMQTARPAVLVPKKDDIMNQAIGDIGKSIVVMPPEISNNELKGGAAITLEEEKLHNPVDRSPDTDKPEGVTVVTKSKKEAMEISVARSPDIIDRPEEGATVVMELEKEAMETHNIPEDDNTNVPRLGYENFRAAALGEEDTKEKPCSDVKDVAEKDVDESTGVYEVKQTEGEGSNLLMEKDGDNTTDALGEGRDLLMEKNSDNITDALGEGCDLLMEKDGDNITDALGQGCDLLMEKDGYNVTDALGVELAAEGQGTSLTQKGMHDGVEEITLVEQADEESERATRIGAEDIPKEITQAHEMESDNDMTKDSKNSTNGETSCSSATVLLEGGMMEKQCIQNVELNVQRELSSDAAAIEGEGVYDHKTMDKEVALTQKHDHKIIGENRETTILKGSHMLDSGVKSDLITLQVDEIHTAGGMQNQEISDLDKEMAPKQKQDHLIIWEHKEATVSEGSHMPDSRVNSDLVTLETDETHAGGGIQNLESLALDKEMALKQKHNHIMACENKETTEPRGIRMLDGRMKSDLVTLEVDGIPAAEGNENQDIEVDGTPAAEGNENQDILDFNKQQGMHGTRDLGTTIENNKMNMSEDEDIPVCSAYQIGPAIENNKMNMSEDAVIPDCGEYQIDPTDLEVSEVEFTRSLQNKELFDNKEQLAMEERQNLGIIIENNKMNLPNEVDILVCVEHQIDSTGTEVIGVKSTNGIQNQELLDNKEDQVTEKKMECEIAYESGIPSEEVYELGDRMDTPAGAVNVSDSGQNKETCTTEEAMEDKQYQEVEHVNEERILEDTIVIDSCELKSDATDLVVDMAGSKEGTLNQYALSVETEAAMQEKQGQEMAGEDTNRDVEVDMVGSNEGTLNQYALSVETEAAMQEKQVQEMASEDTNRDVEVDMAGSKEGTLNQYALSVETEAAMQEKQDQEMASEDTNRDVEVDMAGSKEGTLNQYALSVETEAAMQEKQAQEMTGEDTNRDVADMNALEFRVEPDGAVKMSHETLLTEQSVDMGGSKLSSEDKEKAVSFEEHNATEVAGIESNQTAGMKPEGALPPEPENLVEVEQENLENETKRSTENDEASCKDQTSACVVISPSNVDDQCADDNGWAEESTKSYDKLASDPINTACHHPVKFGKSINEEIKRSQHIRSMYLKDIKESLGRIRAEPSNRVQATNLGYPSRHAVQESHSACKEIKVPLRDSGRDFGRDRALELVVTSPAEETSRWRQEQYALQILEDVQNARSAEKTRMEMEIRILKAQIASMERQVMNLDHFSEVKSRSKRH